MSPLARAAWLAGVAALMMLAASCGAHVPSAVPSSSSSTASANSSPCLGPSVSSGEVIDLRPSERLQCFGASSLTIVVFYPQVFGAGGCDGSLLPGDGWLRPCDEDGLGVVPERGVAGGMTIYLSPASGVTKIHIQPDQWLRVTGHFDDPAALMCRVMDPAGQIVVDPVVIRQCRELFAVTELEVVGGPS
jgi:hypothetical protein